MRAFVTSLVLGLFLMTSATAAPWIAARPCEVGRFSHTSTLLLNGQVLIAGGVVGYGDNTNSVELYDSSTDAAKFTGSLLTSRLLSSPFPVVAEGRAM